MVETFRHKESRTGATIIAIRGARQKHFRTGSIPDSPHQEVRDPLGEVLGWRSLQKFPRRM
jgi:hypothetical protein